MVECMKNFTQPNLLILEMYQFSQLLTDFGASKFVTVHLFQVIQSYLGVVHGHFLDELEHVVLCDM